MALEKTMRMINVFRAKMTLASMVTEQIRENVPTDDLSLNPVQALYAAHHAMILYSQAEIVANLIEEATRPDNPLVQNMNLEPLVLTIDSAIRSIDAALQAAGVDMGLKEEWMKC